MKFKLLRDCPHGTTGSIWRSDGEGDGWISLVREKDDKESIWNFPKYNLAHWFVEIKDVRFTKEQAEAIRDVYGHCLPRELAWLEEHTDAGIV